MNEKITRNAGVFINNSARLLCLTTDRKLCLAPYYLNGEFDISSILLSDTPSAINWGLELFECFERSSKLLQP
uniref:transcriptional regulator FilR1 domain-containing protein n=1 Tax=Archaeoglobus neptunius TaxID=2798580 RepID=UPI00192839D2